MDITLSINFYILFFLVCFAILIVAKYAFHKDGIFTLAIGAVIGANVYNVGNFPVPIGPFIFGMDAVVYTIFLFCVLSMYVEYGKASFKTLLYTALFSIFFSAMLSTFGQYLKTGSFTEEITWTGLSYLSSIIATFTCCWCMVSVYDFLKRKNCNFYLNIVISLILASMINSTIYFGLTFLFTGDLGDDFARSLFSSYIVKAISGCIFLLLLHIEQTYFKIHKKRLSLFANDKQEERLTYTRKKKVFKTQQTKKETKPEKVQQDETTKPSQKKKPTKTTTQKANKTTTTSGKKQKNNSKSLN